MTLWKFFQVENCLGMHWKLILKPQVQQLSREHYLAHAGDWHNNPKGYYHYLHTLRQKTALAHHKKCQYVQNFPEPGSLLRSCVAISHSNPGGELELRYIQKSCYSDCPKRAKTAKEAKCVLLLACAVQQACFQWNNPFSFPKHAFELTLMSLQHPPESLGHHTPKAARSPWCLRLGCSLQLGRAKQQAMKNSPTF